MQKLAHLPQKELSDIFQQTAISSREGYCSHHYIQTIFMGSLKFYWNSGVVVIWIQPLK